MLYELHILHMHITRTGEVVRSNEKALTVIDEWMTHDVPSTDLDTVKVLTKPSHYEVTANGIEQAHRLHQIACDHYVPVHIERSYSPALRDVTA